MTSAPEVSGFEATPGVNPGRDAACRAITQAAEHFPDLPIEPALDTWLDRPHIDPRDAALGHAIYDTVVRRWLTLRHVISLHLSPEREFEKLEPPLRAALLVGAAQLLFFDRLPMHSAVDQSVEWAKRVIRRGAGGFVNAVLRKIAAQREPTLVARWSDERDLLPRADGAAIRLRAPDGRASQDVLPADPLTRLAIATSHPERVVRRWAEPPGLEGVRNLCLHNLVAPPLILNIEHWSAAERAASGLQIVPHDDPRHAVCTSPHFEISAELSRSRSLWVQDPASATPVRLVRDDRVRAASGEIALIADLCAGQGTKTRQLLYEFPAARIIATDVDAARLETLRRTFASEARVAVLSPDDARAACAGRADLVLLDVPCSNSGVLARRVEARYRLADVGSGHSTMERLVAIQRQILSVGDACVRPGGLIVYATCSLEAEENESQVAFASAALGLELLAGHTSWPTGLPGDAAARYRDGSFGAVLRRPEDRGQPA